MTENAPAHGDEAAYARLRWQCRRGMLELDHLLLPFLERGYAGLDAGQRQTFQRLLAQQDTDLSDWFMSRSEPPDAQLAELIRHIITVVSATPG